MMKKIVIDYRYIDIAKKYWGNRYEIIPSQKIEKLAHTVCAHPDMALIRVGNSYIVEKTVYEAYKKILSGTDIICGETALDTNYPADVAYNVLISGRFVFAKESSMDAKLKRILLQNGYEIKHIQQGYAKCSAAVFRDCIITADPSIISVAFGCGLHVCTVRQGDVKLPGYDYGFIGGASGFVDGTLFFFGDITKHGDFEKIKDFTDMHHTSIEWIPDYPLTDVGTILGIE